MVDLGKAMRSKVLAAIEKAPKLGLRNMAWDCNFVLVPVPTGMQPGYAVIIQCSSMVLGQVISTLSLIGDVNADQKDVNDVINKSVDQLRAAYAASGSVSNGAPGGPQHG